MATKEVWVSNIVVVDDYETKPGEPYGVFICGCGFETTDENTMSEHFKKCFKEGNTSNFTVQTHYTQEETVWVGSHEEDQGWYETSTYVDYQYCDCGATK